MSLQVPRSDQPPADLVAAEIDALAPWFHNLHLPSGHQTARAHPLGDFPAFKWRAIANTLPADLTGARALDIGCNAGYYSFALADRGAEVLAVDLDEHYLRQGRWAAQRLDPAGRITFRQMHLYDLLGSPERFDVVLFLGVLYHLRYPQLALDGLAPLVSGRMIVQTLTTPGEKGQPATSDVPFDVPSDVPFEQRERLAAPGWPRAAFIERSFAGDPTNWWAPDDACVRAMLRSAGLQVTATPAHEIYVCEPSSASQTPDVTAELRTAELDAVLRQRGGGAGQESSPSQRK